MFKRYVASKRHTMQVDFEDYVLGVAPGAPARRGARRARRRPPARAAAPGGARVTAAATGRRERTKAANRAALLAAARDVFGELGYEAVGVRDIVRRTDLASGTFYNYFPDKEAVFRAVVEETGAEARAARPRRPRAARPSSRRSSRPATARTSRSSSRTPRRSRSCAATSRRSRPPGSSTCCRSAPPSWRRTSRRSWRGGALPAARPRLLGPRDGRRRRRAGRAHGRARAARRRRGDPLRHRAVPRRRCGAPDALRALSGSPPCRTPASPPRSACSRPRART